MSRISRSAAIFHVRRRRARGGIFFPIAVLLLAGLSVAACSEPDRDPANAPRSTADLPSSASAPVDPLDDPFDVPAMQLTTLDGGDIQIGPSAGRVQIINFWATWCAPCLQEIPDLNELHQELGPQGFEVIGVAKKQGPETVRPFVSKHDIQYPIVPDSLGKVGEELGPVYVLPTSLVVNADGQVIYQVSGIFPTAQLADTLRSMVEASAS